MKQTPIMYQITVHVNNYDTWKGVGSFFYDLDFIRKNKDHDWILKEFAVINNLDIYYGSYLDSFREQFRKVAT